jgi:glycosyltransferase involved in cell wall biosynthesis
MEMLFKKDQHSARMITILRETPYKPSMSLNSTVLVFSELREKILSGKIFKDLFRYKQGRVITHRLDVMSKPFKTALLLRLLCREGCFLEDELGNIKKITLYRLVLLLRQLFKDWREKNALLSRAAIEIQEIVFQKKILEKKKGVNWTGSPIYLRTDLIFGLRSGGSVGHIAGVLNHLEFFTGKPIFMTTDIIPTVRKDIETKIVVPTGKFWDFKEIPAIYFNEVVSSEVRKYIGDRKISFVYQRYSLNNYSGVKLAQRLKVPFVLEYNGSEIWMSRHWGKPLKYETLTKRIELLNLSVADVVVVVSQPMRDELVMRGIDAEKILVNPNGVDPDRYSPDIDGSHIRAQYHLDGRTVLGFIGTFGKWHGAEILAEAFGRLLQEFPAYRERVRLLMIGDGLMMPQVKERLQKLGALEAATLTGLVPQEQGPAYLAASDILVASHVPNPDGTPFFGSPTKLFEYMAMGKGIVASDLDQIGEVLKHDYSALLVKPGNVESLMLGLKKLIDDEQGRLKLGKAARQEVVARYTWKEHTRKTIEKLKEHCG